MKTIYLTAICTGLLSNIVMAETIMPVTAPENNMPLTVNTVPVATTPVTATVQPTQIHKSNAKSSGLFISGSHINTETEIATEFKAMNDSENNPYFVIEGQESLMQKNSGNAFQIGYKIMADNNLFASFVLGYGSTSEQKIDFKDQYYGNKWGKNYNITLKDFYEAQLNVGFQINSPSIISVYAIIGKRMQKYSFNFDLSIHDFYDKSSEKSFTLNYVGAGAEIQFANRLSLFIEYTSTIGDSESMESVFYFSMLKDEISIREQTQLKIGVKAYLF